MNIPIKDQINHMTKTNKHHLADVTTKMEIRVHKINKTNKTKRTLLIIHYLVSGKIKSKVLIYNLVKILMLIYKEFKINRELQHLLK